jgi:hypothetical protein
MELIQANFGPQLLNLLIDAEEVATVLARKFGVPDTLVRDKEQRRMLSEMAQQMAQQAHPEMATAEGLGKEIVGVR